MGRRGASQRLLAALLAAGLTFASSSPAPALSYWLEHGLKTKPLCPGDTAGRPLKIANEGGEKFLITAIAICTDTGDAYKLHFDFLSVRVNPTEAIRIDRPVIEFDWVGLAVYKPANASGERIEWLYDEARMIEGSLSRDDGKPVHFGNFEFLVPKAAADAATHFTFYITWKGPLETFGVL